jgi:Fe-S oxidoreductase
MTARVTASGVPYDAQGELSESERTARAMRTFVREFGATASFHDPCQVVRRGGVRERPRDVLRALGFEFKELADHGPFAYCCGGRGGVVSNTRAGPLRYRAFEIKRRQIEDAGAEHFVTGCGQCRITFELGAKHFKWDQKTESLLELVADNLEGE